MIKNNIIQKSNIIINDKNSYIAIINDNLNAILKSFGEGRCVLTSDNLKDINSIIVCLQELVISSSYYYHVYDHLGK